jgi:hypothetical protein
MSKVEQIRSAITDLDNDIAKDTLALLLANIEGKPEAKSNNAVNTDSIFLNFAQAINYLKRE